MERRFHRGFTAAEKTELWDRWKRGESLKAIGRAFGKPSSSIYFLVNNGRNPANTSIFHLRSPFHEPPIDSAGKRSKVGHVPDKVAKSTRSKIRRNSFQRR